MKLLLTFLTLLPCILFAENHDFFPVWEKPVAYEGKYLIYEDGTILLFYDEHIIEVTNMQHYEKCWCKPNLLE